MQILESDSDPKTYYVWFRWARVGYVGQNTCLSCGSNTSKAINTYKKKFKDKTVNDWDDRNDFIPHAKKYTYIPMDYKSKQTGGGDNEYVYILFIFIYIYLHFAKLILCLCFFFQKKQIRTLKLIDAV